MRLTGMGQLAVSVKESLKTLTIDNHTEVEEKVPSVQNRYIDSVEFSNRAIELSTGVDTETGSNTDTDQGDQENPGTNQQQQEPAFTGAVSLNVFA
ncbi:MAG: hypothetical protein ACYST3_03840 [Planctomycetota bacterium]|jgi:hypothetical protein